jgi:hypothetical protein
LAASSKPALSAALISGETAAKRGRLPRLEGQRLASERVNLVKRIHWVFVGHHFSFAFAPAQRAGTASNPRPYSFEPRVRKLGFRMLILASDIDPTMMS